MPNPTLQQHRVGSIENDRDYAGYLTGKLTIPCVCGWRIRFSPHSAGRASRLALGHQLGRLETRATLGFLPTVDLDGDHR